MNFIHSALSFSSLTLFLFTAACSGDSGGDNSPGETSEVESMNSSGGTGADDPTSEGTGGGTGDEADDGAGSFDFSSLPPLNGYCTLGDACGDLCVRDEDPGAPGGCEWVTSIYAPDELVVFEDELYLTHLSGVSKAPLAGGTVEHITPETETTYDFAGGIVIVGDQLYFGTTTAGAALYRTPLEGGDIELVVDTIGVHRMTERGGTIFMGTGFRGLQLAVLEGTTATEVGPGEWNYSFFGADTVYWSEIPESILTAPVTDPQNISPLPAGEVEGDFVIVEGDFYAVGKASSELYFHGPERTDKELLWDGSLQGTEGSIERLKVSPENNAFFFVYETEEAHYLMMWDIDADEAKYVTQMNETCMRNYTISGEYAYLSGCRGVYRITLP